MVRGIWNHPTTGDLKVLPPVDRILTKYWLYAGEKGSGNYKYLPGTHSMIGRDCWWRHQGGCTFCSWTSTFKNWRVGTVDQFMREVENCASLGIREMFDDTGTFPIGDWLQRCCDELRKFNKGKRHGACRVTVGCNMRPGALTQDQYSEMGASGFRFILYGLESANQKTIDWINKGQSPGDMERSAKWASEAGLDPHATCMVGYPIETYEDAKRTIDFTKHLFSKGYIKTLQATIVIPYPGTALYEQCLKNDWLKYPPGDWNKWDMRRPVMKSPIPDRDLLALTRGIYRSFLTPRYLVQRLVSVRTWDDVRALKRAARALVGHLHDFSGGGSSGKEHSTDA